MSRRSSSGSLGRSRGGADAAMGEKGASSHSENAGLEMERFRTALLSSLTSVVTDTVDTVCEEHEEKLALAVRQLHGGSGGGGGGGSFKRNKQSRAGADVNGGADDGEIPSEYDLFHRCCMWLINYIDTNMSTSPDFKQQMERVILACHSNASEVVLRSVVTKKLWFHAKSLHSTDDDGDQEEQEDEEEEEDEVYTVRGKASRGKAPVSRRAPVKAPPPPPARSAKRRVSAPPPPPRSAKSNKSPVKKRARRESASHKTSYAPSETDDEDLQVEESPRKRKRRATRIRYSDDEDEAQRQDDDDDDVVFVTNGEANANQPHYGQADELLQFKDAIGDMCYADRRTPAQTRFFKERLRKAIQFVDAQLCKPPKGKSCGWECAKIRRQMCNRDLPCRNKICRLWHDVEAHTDRCRNTHCEFRIRVMLRETMYKIDHKKLELQAFRNELHTKKKELLELKGESVSDRENFVERRLLENETDQLESEIENAEKDLGMFKATKKSYWATLNEIGLTVEDDDNDGFPQFNGHYVDKKTAAKKKKTAAKATRHSDEYTTSSSALASAGASRSERSRRRQSFESVNSTASPVQKRDRITRRSTQQSLKVLTNGVIELDGDEDNENDNEEEETKTDRSADDENSARATRNEVDESEETRSVHETREKDEENDGADKSNDQQSADISEKDGENEARDKDTPPSSAVDSVAKDAAQSADYVIESEGTKTSEADLTAEVSMNSALEDFNQVVDAHSKPSDAAEADGQAPKGDEQAQASKDTTEEDNAPHLPF
jgi:hypothetical protein